MQRSAIFERIWRENEWGFEESRSGPGSGVDRTQDVRRSLEALFERTGARLIYDAPCGDFNWMRLVKLPEGARYLGADIVRPMIEALNARYGDDVRRFMVADIVEDEPPAADLWLCRKSLFHLTHSEVAQVLERWRRSGIPWFVATTTPTVTENTDIETGYWRPLNLQAPPFSMEAPVAVLPDAAPGDPAKVLGVWRQQV